MAMKDEGATLGEKALQQIAKGLRDIQRLKKDDRSTGLTANARQSNYQVKWDMDIDAATNSVTTPGLGTATIWARVSGGDLYDTGRVLDVVNRSESISYVSGNWGKVERINGEWQPYTGGGGGETIRFEIYAADCDNRSAVVQILSSRLSSHNVTDSYTIDGQTEVNELGETVASRFVAVYDKAGCYLNESNRNLRTRVGYATYVYGRPLHQYDPWWSWEVIALCEQQTTCEAF